MKNKQLFKNMVFTILAFMINLMINFFLTPYISNNVGVEAYGFVSLANNFVMYASIFTIALNSLTGRFITVKLHSGDLNGANQYFTSVVYANIFLSLILLIPSFIIIYFLDHIITIPNIILTDVKILFALVFINFALSIVNATYSTATFTKNRLDLSSKINIKSYILKSILLIILYNVFSTKILYIGAVSCIVTSYLLIKNIQYTKQLMPEITINKKYFDIRAILEILTIGTWNTITRLGQILTDGLDLLITNLFISPLAMGQVAVVKTVATTFSSFISIFTGVFLPQQTIDYARGKLDKTVNNIKFSMKATGIIAVSVSAFIIVFGREFYTLWLPKENIEILFQLSMLTFLNIMLASVIVPLWQIFTITAKLKLNSLIHIGYGLFNVVSVYFLLHVTNLEVFVVVGFSAITAIIKNVTYLPIYASKCLEISIFTFYPEIFKNFLLSLLLILLNLLLNSIIVINSWIALFTCAVISCLSGLLISCYVMFSKKERTLVLNSVMTKIKGENYESKKNN